MTLENLRISAFLVLVKASGFFVVAVRAMAAAALAAVAALQVVLFREYDIAFGTVIEIFGIQLFFKHHPKDIIILVMVKNGVHVKTQHTTFVCFKNGEGIHLTKNVVYI